MSDLNKKSLSEIVNLIKTKNIFFRNNKSFYKKY